MNRLNFSIPEFTRIIWSSEQARDIWQTRFACINSVWPKIELGTVAAGIRRGALQTVTPFDLIGLQNWCFDNEISFVIVTQEAAAKVYGNASQPVVPGQPWNYRVYVGDDPKGFMQAWLEQNNEEIGSYLGYPSCCTEFFQKHWVEGGWRDLTLCMTQNTTYVGSFHCNTLLRHLGMRAVFHLPCSLGCDITRLMGTKILEYAKQAGFDKEVEWLTDILNWPVRWSSLHGVAMITTPVVKIIASTDPLPEEIRYDLPGSSYPEGGAIGVEFPFQSSRPMMVGIKDTWSDNGFSSFIGMRRAHDLILKSVGKIILESGRVLDLGCGNGMLLERITDEHRHLVPYGIENNPERYWRAKERLGPNISNADLFNTSFYLQPNFELALISLNRFGEVEEAESDMLLRRLRSHTRYLIVYAYDAWQTELDAVLLRHFVYVDVEVNDIAEARILKPR